MINDTLGGIALIASVFISIAFFLLGSNTEQYRKVRLIDGNGKEWYRIQSKHSFMFYTWWETEWYDDSDHPDMCEKVYFEFDTAEEADQWINKKTVRKYYH